MSTVLSGKHSNGISPCSNGNISSIRVHFPIAMLVYQRSSWLRFNNPIESTMPIHPLRPPAYFGYDNTSPYDLRCSSGKPWTPAKKSIRFFAVGGCRDVFLVGKRRKSVQGFFQTKTAPGKMKIFLKKSWRGGWWRDDFHWFSFLNLGEFLRWCLAAYESYEIFWASKTLLPCAFLKRSQIGRSPPKKETSHVGTTPLPH